MPISLLIFVKENQFSDSLFTYSKSVTPALLSRTFDRSTFFPSIPGKFVSVPFAFGFTSGFSEFDSIDQAKEAALLYIYEQ